MFFLKLHTTREVLQGLLRLHLCEPKAVPPTTQRIAMRSSSISAKLLLFAAALLLCLASAEMSADVDASGNVAMEGRDRHDVALRVAGHTGKQSAMMGVYARDVTHSPKRGVNVYSQEGASGVHLHKGTNGKWYIYDTARMISGFAGGFLGSTTASPSPLGLQWKASDGTALHLDPLLTVTKIS